MSGETRRRPHVVGVRFTDEELKVARDMAADQHLTIPALCRDLIAELFDEFSAPYESVQVRLTPDEMFAVRLHAQRVGMTVSDLLRGQALAGLLVDHPVAPRPEVQR